MLLWLALLTPVAWTTVQALPHTMQQALQRSALWLGGTPIGLLALTLPLAWIGAGYDHGIVTPSGSFLPPLAEWIHNGLFYGFGLCLHLHRKALMAHYERHWPALAGLGLVGFLHHRAAVRGAGPARGIGLCTGAGHRGVHGSAGRACIGHAPPAVLDGAGLQQRVVAVELCADRAVSAPCGTAPRLAGLPGRQPYWVYLVHLPLPRSAWVRCCTACLSQPWPRC